MVDFYASTYKPHHSHPFSEYCALCGEEDCLGCDVTMHTYDEEEEEDDDNGNS